MRIGGIRISGRAASLALGAAVPAGGAVPLGGTHVRLGGTRIDLRSTGTLGDAADLLAGLGRANVRAIRSDAALREEALRRALSPAVDRCRVQGMGTTLRHDCTAPSGFQYASDEEAQALEACSPNDVWSDIRGLIIGHKRAGRGPDEPIVADCDDLTPSALGVAAYISWFAPPGLLAPDGTLSAGQDLSRWRDDDARFAVAITRPPKAEIAHAYGLTNRVPPWPQPKIEMGKGWYVWDPAAHWGMPRPRDEFYRTGDVVAHEVRRADLDGIF